MTLRGPGQLLLVAEIGAVSCPFHSGVVFGHDALLLAGRRQEIGFPGFEITDAKADLHKRFADFQTWDNPANRDMTTRKMHRLEIYGPP